MKLRSEDKPNTVLVRGNAFLYSFSNKGLILEVVDKVPAEALNWVILPDTRPYLVYGTCEDDLTVELVRD